MPRALLALGFCAFALAQSPAPASQPVDLRFAQPDADVKMSLNVQAFLNSPTVAKAIADGGARAQGNANAMQIQLVLALLKTVDRVSLSVRQKEGKDMDVLAQLTGSFDPQLIAGMFPSAGSSKVKVVGPHTLLIGDGDSFVAAAARLEGPPLQDDELETSDFWISIGADFLTRQMRQQTGQAMSFPAMRGISLGLNWKGDAPEINTLLTAVDEAGASNLLKTLQAGMALAAQSNPAAGGALKSFSLTQDGAKVRMHYVIPPEMIALGQQLARQQAASGAVPAQLMPLLGIFGLGGDATPPSAPARPSQNGGVIKIYGLDGGTKVIQPK
jgi:hypothetical protein